MAVNFLEAVPLFAGLSTEAVSPLCESVRKVSIAEGEVLFRQGDPGDTMYMIESGRLKVFTTSLDERELVLDIMGPGMVLGELALLDGKPRSATSVALAACDLLALDREPFMTHLQAYPETAMHLLQYLSANLRQRVLHAEQLMVSNSPARLANALLFLAERDGGRIQTGVVTSTLSKKDLARTIGTSEEWVAQMLDQWCRDGIIGMTGPRRLLVHDVAALRELAHAE